MRTTNTPGTYLYKTTGAYRCAVFATHILCYVLSSVTTKVCFPSVEASAVLRGSELRAQRRHAAQMHVWFMSCSFRCVLTGGTFVMIGWMLMVLQSRVPARGFSRKVMPNSDIVVYVSLTCLDVMKMQLK